jgi:hypothetical protein
MNETEDSNKKKNEICKMMKQHPNMLDMLKTILQEMKTTERMRISKVDAKQTRLRRVMSEFGT